MGPVHFNGAAGIEIGEIGEVVGEESAFDAVDAKLKMIAARGGGDGVGARLLLAVGVLGHGRDELARRKRKALLPFDDKVEVITLGDLGDAFFTNKTGGRELTCQGCSR